MADLKKIKPHGFTLIELMVVIAIIGLLASTVLASLDSVRATAHDAKIYSDLNQLQIALEMYHADFNSYPSTGSAWWTVCTTGLDTVARDTNGPSGYIPNLAPKYIPELPTNPTGCVGGAFGGYIYLSNGNDYKLSTDWSAEIGTQCQLEKKFADPPRTTINHHTFCSIYTPSAAGW